MKGIDSGSYSLRFSKIGYETNQIDNVLCNGKDSIQIKYILKDSVGITRIYDEIFLSESTPSISIVNATASATEFITTITNHNINRDDTTYSWEAKFSVNLESTIKETQDSLAAGFMVRITNRNTISPSEMPTAFYDTGTELTNGWLGFYGHSIKTKPVYTGTRDFILSQGSNAKADRIIPLEYFNTLTNYQVKKSEQLYLHIIPVVKELKRVQHSNRFSTWFTFEVGYKFGDLHTIPIQWK